LTDVIEHVLYPEELIVELKRYLSPNGQILFSVPNIRYIGALHHILVEKDFKYRESGIFDRTHLSFFTEKSFSNLMKQLSFDIILKQGINPGKGLKANLLKPFFKIIGWSDVYFLQFVFIVKPQKK
jgi:2-polyprenyl-3-methyl-5-hydroxy-6-metoxy-1,4-benzoquinol methylase